MTREAFIYSLPTLTDIRLAANNYADTPKEVSAFFIGAIQHLVTVAVRFHPGVNDIDEIYPDIKERCEMFVEFKKETGYEGMGTHYIKGEKWFLEQVEDLLESKS